MYNPRFEKDVFKRDVRNNVKTLFRKEVEEATPQQLFQAVSYAVKEAIIDDWLATQKQYEEDRILHVHGIPARKSSRKQPDQHDGI